MSVDVGSARHAEAQNVPLGSADDAGTGTGGRAGHYEREVDGADASGSRAAGATTTATATATSTRISA